MGMMKMNDFDEKRNESLIEERVKYEEEYFNQMLDEYTLERIVDEMVESVYLDNLIAERFEYIDNHFDFEPSPEYERLEEFYYSEFDSIAQEQISDVDDYIDYPDGPDENIDGIIYNWPDDQFYDDFESDYEDLQIEPQIEKELIRLEKIDQVKIQEL